MFQKIIAFSIRQKVLVGIGVMALIVTGIFSLNKIPIDAVPDITNNQVQVVTTSPGMAAEDVEKFVTYPIELAMANLPHQREVRSISRYGLSIVTIVFEEDLPVLESRQLTSEQLNIARSNIPAGMGNPEMMPITTGLGEVYQYVLKVEPSYADQYNSTDLREIQDWIVKRHLSGIDGIVEVSSFGGKVKQYEVAFDPEKLNAFEISIGELVQALETSNANSGGGYVERGNQAVYIRTEGLLRSLDEIGAIPIVQRGGSPVLVRDVASVNYGHALRYGAMTQNGEGEAVGGITLMLKGENANTVVNRVKERVKEVQNVLPPGVYIEPYLDRSALVGRTIRTVITNLAEGGLFVSVLLIFFLGNFRAGLLVASVIPLSMLFALIMMRTFGVSANLMSLGAIDFGIVVDGAVIIVEGILHYQAILYAGKSISQGEMDKLVRESSSKIYSSAAFGILIILVVFVPVLQLQGVEGKMFKPMALTLMFALGGAMILSVTYIPAAASVFLPKKYSEKRTFGERIMEKVRKAYAGRLMKSLDYKKPAIAIALILLALTFWRITTMGSVFLPELEEGDLAMQMAVEPGSNLEKTISTATEVETILLENFPEVKGVVSKIGTAEVPTDPMAIEDADVMILLKPKSDWETATTREELVEKMKARLTSLPEVSFEFTQPIQLRFNELLTGSKSDIAIKIFGEDHETLSDLGQEAEALIANVPGAADVKVERTEGLQQYVIGLDREKMAWYGVTTETVNKAVETAYAGAKTGVVLDGERRFDLVVRLKPEARINPDLTGIFVVKQNGERIPLSEVASLKATEGPSMISRENTRRRIIVGVNVRNRSLSEVVGAIEDKLGNSLELPPGYSISYEGEFKNLEEARNRLAIAVPIALAIIVLLLFMAYRKWRYVLLIFTSIPFAAIGGVWLLTFRDMPFSISAGIGFIALFGVAVLNGIVMISHINEIRLDENVTLRDAIVKGASDRIRPVLLTDLVATFGFLPMALSTSAGAEVQKPLATVVIGGLITATLLTLFILPMLYEWIERKTLLKGGKSMVALGIVLALAIPAQSQDTISWGAFLEKAMSENANYEIENLKVDMAKARKSDAWEIGKTEAFYGYGQINRADIKDDFLWNFNQNFGSIPQHINKAKLRRAEIASSEAELEIFAVNFETDLEKAYLNWVIAKRRVEFLRGFTGKLDSLDERVVNQLDAGDIDPEERLLFKSQVLHAGKALLNAESEALSATLNLETLCLFSLEDTHPIEDLDYVLSMEIPESLAPDLLIEPRKMRIDAQKKELKSLKAGFFPDLSLGYQVGRVEGVRGADAFSIGLALPIWYAPDKSRIKTANIQLDREKAQLRRESFYYESALKNAMGEYLLRKEAFNRNGSEFKTGSNTLEKKALYRYNQGETDVYRLIISLSASKDLRLSYLDILREYGASKIELKRFSN